MKPKTCQGKLLLGPEKRMSAYFEYKQSPDGWRGSIRPAADQPLERGATYDVRLPDGLFGTIRLTDIASNGREARFEGEGPLQRGKAPSSTTATPEARTAPGGSSPN